MNELFQGHSAEYWYREAQIAKQRVQQLDELATQLQCQLDLANAMHSDSASVRKMEQELHSAHQEVAALRKNLRQQSRLLEERRMVLDQRSKEVERLRTLLSEQHQTFFLEFTEGMINPQTGTAFATIEEWNQWKEATAARVKSRLEQTASPEEQPYTPPPHHLHRVPDIPQNAIKTRPQKSVSASAPRSSINKKRTVWKLQLVALIIILLGIAGLSFCSPSNAASQSAPSSFIAVQPTPRPTAKPYSISRPQSTAKPSTGSWGSDNTTTEITGSLSQTAYWTKSGKSYHFKTSCPSLSRSKNIYSGTLQDALDAGKLDPCDLCAK